MDLVSLPLMLAVLAVGAATVALAGGGGASAGGSGAHTVVKLGRAAAEGQAGPLGATNNPRRSQEPAPAGGIPNSGVAH